MTEHTRRGARGFILPAGHAPGNPAENRLLPQTAAEFDRAAVRPREIVADGGFLPGGEGRCSCATARGRRREIGMDA